MTSRSPGFDELESFLKKKEDSKALKKEELIPVPNDIMLSSVKKKTLPPPKKKDVSKLLLIKKKKEEVLEDIPVPLAKIKPIPKTQLTFSEFIVDFYENNKQISYNFNFNTFTQALNRRNYTKEDNNSHAAMVCCPLCMSNEKMADVSQNIFLCYYNKERVMNFKCYCKCSFEDSFLYLRKMRIVPIDFQVKLRNITEVFSDKRYVASEVGNKYISWFKDKYTKKDLPMESFSISICEDVISPVKYYDGIHASLKNIESSFARERILNNIKKLKNYCDNNNNC